MSEAETTNGKVLKDLESHIQSLLRLDGVTPVYTQFPTRDSRLSRPRPPKSRKDTASLYIYIYIYIHN